MTVTRKSALPMEFLSLFYHLLGSHRPIAGVYPFGIERWMNHKFIIPDFNA